jgi:hypothetical protein
MKMARNIRDFIMQIQEQVKRRPKYGYEGTPREFWLDPTTKVKGGNTSALDVLFDGYLYKLNANSDIRAIASFIDDLSICELVVVSVTKESKDKMDTFNMKETPRKGLYLYREDPPQY